MSLSTRVRASLAASSCLLATVVAAAPAAHAATGSLGSCITAGTTIAPGQYLAAPARQIGPDLVVPYRLAMQGDGNFVEYDSADRALWDSQTAGNPGAYAVLQGSDGNLVVYSSSGRALWAAYPGSAAGDQLCMQGDGNVVVYSSAHSPLWATMTGPVYPTGNLSGGNYYPAGQCTWWAEQQAARYTGVYPRIGGNAKDWATNAAANGWHVDSTPHIGSIAVFQPGVDGAGSFGHVAWVTEVYPSRNAITITEMNYIGLGVVDTRTVSPASGVNGLQYIALRP